MNTLMKGNGNGNLPGTTFSGIVDQIFQNNLHRFFDDSYWGFQNASSIPTNIRETDKSYELEMIAPGLKKEDFKISVHRDTLSVDFEHKEENNQENKEEGWLRREYKSRSLHRSFTLNDSIDVNKINASYNNGVLYLTLPKKEGAQQVSRSIEIK